MLWIVQSTMTSYRFKMAAGIVHPTTEYNIWLIGDSDVKEFLNLDELESCWLDLSIRSRIISYILLFLFNITGYVAYACLPIMSNRYLHEKCEKHSTKKKIIRFLSLIYLAITDIILATENKSEYLLRMQSYVELHMSVNRGTLYLAPVLNG